jgi:hypothetical protein
VIVLKAFSLDLVGREWLARMSYEARLTREGGGVATQFVNGEAKRYKVIGRDSADTLMSEIFTDMVNSLNLARLFEQIQVSYFNHSAGCDTFREPLFPGISAVTPVPVRSPAGSWPDPAGAI